MYESSKALMRRVHDSRFATRYFVGDGIDIGARPDELEQYAELFPLMRSCRPWDVEDGDAELLASLPDESLDFVHSSHCLEHMQNPQAALRNWLRVIKPGGHLVVLVPDEDMYEQGMFPSTFNYDHKWTFTAHKVKSWSGKSINLTGMLAEVADRAQIIKLEQLDATFRFNLGRFDQTSTPVGECALEFILRKLPAQELERRGRLPSTSTAVRDVTQVRPDAIVQPEIVPAGRVDSATAIEEPRDPRKQRWKFLVLGIAVPTAFHLYRYLNPGPVQAPASIGGIAGQLAGGLVLGYVAWWLWSTVKKTQAALRMPR